MCYLIVYRGIEICMMIAKLSESNPLHFLLGQERPGSRSTISKQTFNSRLHYFRGARTSRLPRSLVNANASPLARTRVSIERFGTHSNRSPTPGIIEISRRRAHFGSHSRGLWPDDFLLSNISVCARTRARTFNSPYGKIVCL